MKRLITLLLVIISVNVFGQKLSAPTGVTPLTQYSFYAKTSDSTLHAYSGGTWLWWKILSKKQGDALYQPIGSPSPLAYSLSTGYGLSGSSFNGSVARTFTADTTSATGLVSKSRLATNLTGYVPNTRTITINGAVRNLSANQIFNVGTVTSVGATAGTGISISGSPITSSGSITITNTNPAPIGIQDSLTKKANRTFDNVAAGAIPISKLASSTISAVNLGGDLSNLSAGTGMSFTAYNGSVARTANADTTVLQTVANFFPKGDTRYAKLTSIYWQRSGTTLSPATANDSLNIGSGIYKGHGAKSDASDGFLIESSTGVDVGRFGVANTANASLFGGLTVTGAISGASVSAASATITASNGLATTFTNNATSFETIRATNSGSGLIASFRNSGGEVASIGNAGAITGTSLIKTGGTSSQFLKADGTVDSTAYGTGSVTSVAALTLGTTGTDLSSTVANGTTTPVITLQVPTASATNRGALSSADWSTFNGKQGTITLTTTGTSGAATFVANTLNIPNYADGGVLSLSAIGATANANAATITGTVLNLQPASASFGGVITTGTQTIAGNKNFTGYTTVDSILANSYNGTGSLLNLGIASTAGIANVNTFESRSLIYGMAVGTLAAQPLYLYTNDAIAVTIDTSRNSNFGGNLTINKTLAPTQLTAGVGGTDSIVVHNNTTKKLSALSPSYYLTPTGSGTGLSGVVLTSTNQTGIAGDKDWTGKQTITYGASTAASLALSHTGNGRAISALANTNGVAPFNATQQGTGLLAEFYLNSTDQALIRNNGSIYTRGQLEVGNLLVGDSGDSVMVHRAIDLTVRRVPTTGTGSVAFSASPTFTGTVTGASATFTGTALLGGASATNPLSIRTADGESYIRFLNSDGTTYGDFERSVTGSGALRFTGAYFRVTGTLETQAINAGGTISGTSATFSGKITQTNASQPQFWQTYTGTGAWTAEITNYNDTWNLYDQTAGASLLNYTRSTGVWNFASHSISAGAATFSGKIAFSANSGATASGQIGRDATYGMFQWASTGSTDDWSVFSPSLGYIMHVPTGTVNTVFGGNTTSSSIANILGSDGGGKQLKFIGGVTTYNGLIAVQENYGSTLEITASSAVGTTTFNRNIAKFNLSDLSATFSGQITSTRGNAGATVLNANSATTGGQKIDLINTSGRIMMGIEDSAGGSEVTGAPAYSAYLSSVNSQPLVFATNNTVRLTIAASTGAATFSSTVTATGFFESSSILLKDIISRDGDVAYFKWKDKKDDKVHIGYIAEEKQLTNPDQINTDGKYLAVNYIEILVQKVRQLEKEIEQLKSKR